MTVTGSDLAGLARAPVAAATARLTRTRASDSELSGSDGECATTRRSSWSLSPCKQKLQPCNQMSIMIAKSVIPHVFCDTEGAQYASPPTSF